MAGNRKPALLKDIISMKLINIFNPLWNAKEHRLRSLWRLILQLLLFLFFISGSGICLFIINLAFGGTIEGFLNQAASG